MENENKKIKWESFLPGILVGVIITAIVCIIVVQSSMLTQTGSFSDKGGASDSILTSEVNAKLRIIEEGIKEQYLEEMDPEEMENGLYKGFVAGLGDPYSVYHSAEEFAEVLESNQGFYAGIGAYMALDEDTGAARVTGVMKGTPAEEAGLKESDLIIEVDGEEVVGLELTDIVGKIKGQEGTQVVLTVYRIGNTDYVDFTVTRKRIETPTVVYEMFDNGMAYIQITEFSEVTTQQFIDAYNQAQSEGMKSMILDLRGNPGGSMNVVVDIAGYFVPEGLVVYTEDKTGYQEKLYADGVNEIDIPLVVLINENSASASEILAGAIKDYEKGILLGTTTYGKGIVQRIYPLADGSALRLTVSRYYTPKGNNIHEIGIEPDEELERDYDAYLENGTDNQLDRAKEILAGEK